VMLILSSVSLPTHHWGLQDNIKFNIGLWSFSIDEKLGEEEYKVSDGTTNCDLFNNHHCSDLKASKTCATLVLILCVVNFLLIGGEKWHLSKQNIAYSKTMGWVSMSLNLVLGEIYDQLFDLISFLALLAFVCVGCWKRIMNDQSTVFVTVDNGLEYEICEEKFCFL